MSSSENLTAACMIFSGFLAISLPASGQQTPGSQGQGTTRPGTGDSDRSRGDMQQMMDQCNKMMKEGHGNMQMSAEMQKKMDECKKMMESHGGQSSPPAPPQRGK